MTVRASALFLLCACVWLEVLGSGCYEPSRIMDYHSRMDTWTGMEQSDLALVAGFNEWLNGTGYCRRDIIPRTYANPAGIMEIVEYGMRAYRAPFDVSFSPPGDFGLQLAREGLLRNLTDIWQELDLYNRLSPGVVKLVQTEMDVPYNIPYVYAPFGIYHLQSVFDDYGFHEPASFDELLEMCETVIQDPTADFDACFGFWQHENLFPLNIFAWMDHLFLKKNGVDAHHEWTSGQIPYTDPALVELITEMAELVDRNIISASHSIRNMYDRKVMFVMFPDLIGIFASDAAELADLRAFPFPPITDDPEMADNEPLLISRMIVARNSAHVDGLALDFLRYLFSEEAHARMLSHPFVMAPTLLYPLDNRTSTSETGKRMYGRVGSVSSVVETSRDSMRGEGLAEIIEGLMADIVRSDDPLGLIASTIAVAEARRIEVLFGSTVAPVFSVEPGVYEEAVTVEITSPTTNVTIYYTLDGSYPFEQSLVYEGPILLANNDAGAEDRVFNLRAVAARKLLTTSEPLSGTFIIRAPPLPHAPPVAASATSDGASAGVVVAVVLAAVVCLLMVVVPVLWWRWRHREMVFRISDSDDIVIDFDELDMGDLIGMGSYGRVYKAVWRGAVVAVKQQFLSLEDSRQTASDGSALLSTTRGPVAAKTPKEKHLLQLFVREAMVMTRIRHPYVVIFMGVCVDPVPCIITEYMERGSLFDVLHAQSVFPSLDSSLVLTWCHKIAQGMEFLHAHDPPLLHRDFKSLNVLIDANWTPKIADFGLSSLLREDKAPNNSLVGAKKKNNNTNTNVNNNNNTTTTNTHNNTNSATERSSSRLETGTRTNAQMDMVNDLQEMGTLMWTAPEVLENVQAYTKAADVYSYGITMWEMFTREFLYQGLTPLAVAVGVYQSGLRPDHRQVPGQFSDVVPLMTRCWAQEPEDRPSFSMIVKSLVPMVRPEVTLPSDSHGEAKSFTHVVMVGISLRGLLSRALSTAPRSYSMIMRGLHLAVVRLANAWDGYVWEETVSGFQVAFPALDSAMHFVEELTSTVITPIPSTFSDTLWATAKNLPDVPYMPPDHPPIEELPLSLVVQMGMPVAKRDPLSNRWTFVGDVAGTTSQMLKTCPLGHVMLTSTVRNAITQLSLGTALNEKYSCVRQVLLQTAAPPVDSTRHVSHISRHSSAMGMASSFMASGVMNGSRPGSPTQSTAPTPRSMGTSVQAITAHTVDVFDVTWTEIQACVHFLDQFFPIVHAAPPTAHPPVATAHANPPRPPRQGATAAASVSVSSSSSSSSATVPPVPGAGVGERLSGHAGGHLPPLNQEQQESEHGSTSDTPCPSRASLHALSSCSLESSLSSLSSLTGAASASVSSRSAQQEHTVATSAHVDRRMARSGTDFGDWIASRDDIHTWFEDVNGVRFASGTVWLSSIVNVSVARKALVKKLMYQPKDMRRMLDFAELVGSLRLMNHPNLLPINVACFDLGSAMVSVDLIHPGGLNTLINPTSRAMALNVAAKQEIVSQMLHGLAFLEAVGWSFGGSLTPQQVLVDDRLHVYLSDYALLDFRTGGGTMMTAAASGTSYMAPECIRGTTPTSTSDVYSFGCIVLELFTGKPCYSASMTSLQIAMHVMQGGRPTLQGRSLGAGVRDMIGTCLGPPQERPSFHELLGVWRGVLESGTV